MPNVVPSVASVWYYFREQDFKRIADLYAIVKDPCNRLSETCDLTKLDEAEIAKLGILHLNRGVYEGKRLAARYFVTHELPRIGPLLDLLDSGDTLLRDMDDAWLG